MLFTPLAGDLLYLRDEEEKRRFQEVELRDSERSQASIAMFEIRADMREEGTAGCP